MAVAPIEGDALENAKKLLWAREIGSTVAAEIPVANGAGKILFSQLDIQSHVDDSKPNYDPVAERILLQWIPFAVASIALCEEVVDYVCGRS